MKARDAWIAVIAVGITAGWVWAELPVPRPATPPPPAPPPLLFVRLAGPPGLRAGFYEPGRLPQVFPVPTQVGLRPGYVYRFEMTGLPDRPGHPDAPRAIYPTIEVRAVVALAPGVNPANYPVPLTFSPEEIARAQDGSFFTKVAFLECPDRALPVATVLDHPLEIDVRPPADPVDEARTRGQVVVIVRFGERQMSEAELTQQAIPGTVLYPGERGLAAPARPPMLPWACWPAYDPVLGPKPPAECLCDGGDKGWRAGIGADGQLHGLDPSDTVAEYTDFVGTRHVTPSNCVCILAPRYAWTRLEVMPIGHSAVVGPVGTTGASGEILVQGRLPSLVAYQTELLAAEVGRQRPSGTQGSEGMIVADQFQGLVLAVGRLNGASVVGVCKKACEPSPGPLVLCKTVDRQAAQVGDVVTFQLRYTNAGGQPMHDIAVSDSLIGRLEYVPGSAQSDREASLTTLPNEDGSLILRWQIGGDLPPGQSGRITFQARVR